MISATVVTDGSTTSSINAGAVVGVLAGGAADAALVYFAPKIIPEGSGGNGKGEGGEESDCLKKTTAICVEDCTADWFIFKCQIQTTSSRNQVHSSTTGCVVVPITKTISHDPSKASAKTVTHVENQGDPSAPTPPPLPIDELQAYLAKENFRLGIADLKARASSSKSLQ